MFDNSYVIDKLVQALTLGVVYYMLIDQEMTHFLVLFGAAFIVMIVLDTLQGKVGYSSIQFSKLTDLVTGSTENTNTNTNNNANIGPQIVAVQPIETVKNENGEPKKETANTIKLSIKGGSGDQTRLYTAAPVPLECPDPGCTHLGYGPHEVASCKEIASALTCQVSKGNRTRSIENGICRVAPIRQCRCRLHPCRCRHRRRVPSQRIWKECAGGSVLEPMDDPVARAYYASGKLPEPTEDMSQMIGTKDANECCQPNLSPNVATEGVLFDTYNQSQQYLEKLRKGSKQQKTQNQANKEGGNWIPQSASETTKPWDFGTFEFTLDGTGKHHFRAAPYCSEAQVVDVVKPMDPVHGDPLAQECLSDCQPCGLSSLPAEFKAPLKDRVLRESPYRECRESLNRQVKNDPMEAPSYTLVQSHYVPEFPPGPCPVQRTNMDPIA